jgi:uncharacterized protein (TIGR00251 family)
MLADHPAGLVLDVHVQPRASRNAIVGVHADALKIRLTAPPVDNAANQAVIQLLAKTLKCPKSDLEIVAGHTARRKRLLLRIAPGPDFDRRRQALKSHLQSLAGL